MTAERRDDVDLDAAFRAFQAATNEKTITADVLSALLRNAVETGAALSGDGPLALYVPGIGEGVQAAGYAATLHRITGRTIRFASDEPSPEMAEAARRRLEALPFVEGVEITLGSAFGPAGISAHRVDYAELSHMLYYVPAPDAVAPTLRAVVERLSPSGMASLVHNVSGSNIEEIMARYSPLVLPDPVPLVERAAEERGLELLGFDYRAALAFGDPARLDRLRAVPTDGAERSGQTARKVECLCQRGLDDLERAGLLERALDDLKARLDAEGRLEIRNRVQILPSPALAADDGALAKLRESVAQTAAEVPEIARRHPMPEPA